MRDERKGDTGGRGDREGIRGEMRERGIQEEEEIERE